MNLLEEEWKAAMEHVQKELVVKIGPYFNIDFCGSFQGHEAFLTDLHGLKKYLDEDSTHQMTMS